MKIKPNLRFAVFLWLVVAISLSACGSKKSTPVAPVVLPTSIPTEPVVLPTEPGIVPIEVVVTPPIHIILKNFDCTTIADVPQAECEALVILYNTANGDGWLNNANWLATTTVGDWYGVTVEEGHIRSLDLSKNQLGGYLPAELGRISYLVSLILNDNQLTGYIPSEFGNLTILRVLSLSFNQLTGGIPASFGNLTNLTHLYLAINQLSGGVPAELGNLSNLQALNIYDNLLSGNLPISLINLTALTNFNFYKTTLCEPTTDNYQTWKTIVPQYGTTGIMCK